MTDHDQDRRVLAALARSQGAMRRGMLRDLEAIGRRELLRRGGRLAVGAAAVGALARVGAGRAAGQDAAPQLPEITAIPESLKGSGEVRVCSWGGALQEAQREAYFGPFEELSGIKVVEAEGPELSRLKAMVDTGNIEWDVAELDRYSVILLEQEGDYWEPLDYALFDTANIDEGRRYPNAIDMLPYATVIAYRTDVFPEAPQGQADFWDRERFAGPRSTESGSGGVVPFLEAAMLAKGQAPEEIYPIDVDLAFETLSEIRDDVVQFWEAGAQPAQLLADKEAVMVHAWNGRISAIIDEGAPAGVQWNQGMTATDVWAIPKGADNAANAQKFTAFITLPEAQARMSMLIPYGFVNNRSAELIPAERLAVLPTAPDLRDKLFERNIDWWVENQPAVLERWNEWILE